MMPDEKVGIMKRKKVLVDLDNVVYPFMEMMASIIAGNTEKHETSDQLIDLYRSWEIWDDWDVPKGQFDWWWERAIQEGIMWRQGPPIPGAIKGLWRLSDNEWHIHIVTTRLNKFRLHDKAVNATAEWLGNLGIPYRSLSFTADKSDILGDAIIDDSPSNLINHPAKTKILFPSPHNKDFKVKKKYGITTLLDHHEVDPWDEIVEILGRGDEPDQVH